jgi:hypothetical protein
VTGRLSSVREHCGVSQAPGNSACRALRDLLLAARESLNPLEATRVHPRLSRGDSEWCLDECQGPAQTCGKVVEGVALASAQTDWAGRCNELCMPEATNGDPDEW